MKKIGLIFCLIFSSAWGAENLDFNEVLAQAKPGQWVRMKNPGKTETVTVVTQKDKRYLTIEIHSYRRTKPQSWVQQKIDLKTKEVLSCRIKYPDGSIDEVPLEHFKSWIQTLEMHPYKKAGDEEIDVPAGRFSCEHYRTIWDDHLVQIWLDPQIPLLHVVKMSVQGGTSSLVAFGEGGVVPVFE